MTRFRVKSITTENGSTITVNYTQPNPCTAPVTLTPPHQHVVLLSVKWTRGQAAVHRLVQQVDGRQRLAVRPVLLRRGDVLHLPRRRGWHYDDAELVQTKYRTYGQFRGYKEVQTRTGTATSTLTDDVYYRGMDHDNGTTTVNVTDSQGGQHVDLSDLAATSWNRRPTPPTGTIDHSSITSYWVSPPTASRSRTTAASTHSTPPWSDHRGLDRQAITSTTPTTWRTAEIDSTYDTSTGMVTEQLRPHRAGQFEHRHLQYLHLRAANPPTT